MPFLKPRAGETESALAARVLRRALLAQTDVHSVAVRAYDRPETATRADVQLLSAVIVTAV